LPLSLSGCAPDNQREQPRGEAPRRRPAGARKPPILLSTRVSLARIGRLLLGETERPDLAAAVSPVLA
jgi:hypothetical protein